MSKLHDRIIEGDGSHDSPFVIHTSNYVLSAQIQNQIIDGVLGSGAWVAQQRRYSTSARGEAGNEDLCEHLVTVDGRLVSVWFDLYIVTRLITDPKLKEAKRNLMESPAGKAVAEQVRNALFNPPPRPQHTLATITKAMFGLFKPKPRIEIAFDDNQILLNGATLSKQLIFDLVLSGRHSTLQLKAQQVGVLLVMARLRGWSGSSHLFRRAPSGIMLLELEGEQIISDSDAASLSQELTRVTTNHAEPNNPTVIAAKQLATMAASNGFTMRFL